MKFLGGVFVSMLLFALTLPALSAAGEESADVKISITPRSGTTFFNNAFSAATGKVETTISLPGLAPDYPKITPMKVADLGFAPSSAMTFNPKPSMPVCPDDKLGPPPTSNSIPVPKMMERCPTSLIGNGKATFALAKANNPAASRPGEMLIFNGGRVGGLPKIKIYAYSYDIQVGVYTSAILQPSGQLRIEMPYLPFDSAVTAISLSIPGRKTVLPKPQLGLTVTLPAGQDPNYLRAKCVGDGGLPWTADHTLGERDEAGNPFGDPEFLVSDSGVTPCTGVSAVPRLAGLRVAAPGNVVRNRSTVIRVKVRNTGGRTVTGGRLLLTGRGVRAGLSVGSIAGGQTRTFAVRARFRVKGLVKARVRLKTDNAGLKAATTKVRVR